MTERTKPADTTEENDESGKDGAQQIVDFGSALTKTPHGSVYCMTIIGQIEGHNTAASGAKTTKYEHVLPLLAKLEESDEVNGVLFLLNTVGGDVEAGLAIAELIAGMTKPTVSIVLGGSHSIGVPLAVAARRSFAVPSAAMTIHPVRMSGTVIAAPQTYNYFQRLQDRIVAFVSSHSQITAQKFQALMLKRTIWPPTLAAWSMERRQCPWASSTRWAASLTDSSASTARSRRPKESGRHPDLKPRDRKNGRRGAYGLPACLLFRQGQFPVRSVRRLADLIALGVGEAGDVLHRRAGLRQDFHHGGPILQGLLHHQHRGGADVSAGIYHIKFPFRRDMRHRFKDFPCVKWENFPPSPVACQDRAIDDFHTLCAQSRDTASVFGKWVTVMASSTANPMATAAMPAVPMPPTT